MKRPLILLIAAMLCIPMGCALCMPDARAQELRVEFFALDKADAILITTPDGQRVLIDAGTNKDGKQLVKRFAQEGIDSLDALIVTHFDKDHVGGADRILESVRVARVIMPQYEKESSQYDSFLLALKKSAGTQADALPARAQFALPLSGDLTLTVTAAHETYYGEDEENDFSLCVRLAYGDTRFLFPGDAEDARQTELMEEGDIACDVLKVPHHGRMHDASYAFLRAASPAIAFVPDGEEEPASPVLIALLDELGAKIWCTGDGDLTVLSDGKKVWME